ncbi:MAG: sulfotransferase [Cyanobium sp.]
MKLLYIGGLEHSGTTLTEQLLSSHSRSLSLGEIASFFSPAHMQTYLRAWGDHADVRRCSCGSDWEDCPFWGQIIHLNGLNSNLPLVEKYAELIRFIRRHLGDDVIVTDSSKSVEASDALQRALGIEADSQDRFGIVLVAKDVRCFTASMKRKSGGKGLLSAFRSMNYWTHANTTWLNHLASDPSIPHRINLYEHLCLDPLGQINGLLAMVEEAPLPNLDIANTRSHIAMGNKDFLMRNRSRVRYDQRWFTDDAILLAYLINGSARSLNHRLYRMGQQLAADPLNGSAN